MKLHTPDVTEMVNAMLQPLLQEQFVNSADLIVQLRLITLPAGCELWFWSIDDVEVKTPLGSVSFDFTSTIPVNTGW